MANIADKYAELPRIFRKPLWKFWHKVLIRYDTDVTANFMNYGYHGLNGHKHLDLHEKDENDRYCIQLYDHVVNRAAIKDKDVLEVGSGRGGGASFIARYFRPRSYVGLDISSSIIKFCNNYYKVDGLSFKRGSAESQPFDSHSFDAVVNVESARGYSCLSTFFREVHRVLRNRGHFLFADMIYPHEVEDIRQKLGETGFKIVHYNNITRNVVEALNRDTHRRERLIDNKVPKILNKTFKTFAGTLGTVRYNEFATEKYQYWSFVLEKIPIPVSGR